MFSELCGLFDLLITSGQSFTEQLIFVPNIKITYLHGMLKLALGTYYLLVPSTYYLVSQGPFIINSTELPTQTFAL